MKFFHGRGGSVSRGGEPTIEAIRSEPVDVYSGKIKSRSREKSSPQTTRRSGLQSGTSGRSRLVWPLRCSTRERAIRGLMQSGLNSWRKCPRATLSNSKSSSTKQRNFASTLRTQLQYRELALLKIGSRPVSRTGTITIEDVEQSPGCSGGLKTVIYSRVGTRPDMFSIRSSKRGKTDWSISARCTRSGSSFGQ